MYFAFDAEALFNLTVDASIYKVGPDSSKTYVATGASFAYVGQAAENGLRTYQTQVRLRSSEILHLANKAHLGYKDFILTGKKDFPETKTIAEGWFDCSVTE